ncbi:MAG: adenylate/guanylate cyclase domain-containing protein [Burkholderiales bacterium]
MQNPAGPSHDVLSPGTPRRTRLERWGFVAFHSHDTPDQRLRKSLLLLTAGLTNVAAAVWLAVYASIGVHLPSSLLLGYQVASAALLFYFLRTRNFGVYRFVQLTLFLVVPFVVHWNLGGFIESAGIVLLSMIAPLGALLAYSQRGSTPWFVAYAVMIGGVTAYEHVHAAEHLTMIPAHAAAKFGLLNGIVLSSVAYLLLQYMVRQREQAQADLARQHALLQLEREKSEALLRSMLPPYIAQRLKHDASLIADGHADVTVMFADIVDFTRLAAELEPRHVVGLLNHVFTRMDQLCERYGLEKIKTIGDAFMVAGGLDSRAASYVDAIADMAIDLQAGFALDPVLHKYGIAFHVGIATGPVVAGVIGSTRFSYDVWGDTVNVAARLSAESPAGAIFVDRVTYSRLAGRYEFGEPREMTFKGKGRLLVFQLLRRLGTRDQEPRTDRHSSSADARSLASTSDGNRA